MNDKQPLRLFALILPLSPCGRGGPKGRRGGRAALVALRLDSVRGISARKRAPHPLPNPPPSRGRGLRVAASDENNAIGGHKEGLPDWTWVGKGFWFTQRRRGAEASRRGAGSFGAASPLQAPPSAVPAATSPSQVDREDLAYFASTDPGFPVGIPVTTATTPKQVSLAM